MDKRTTKITDNKKGAGERSSANNFRADKGPQLLKSNARFFTELKVDQVDEFTTKGQVDGDTIATITELVSL